MEKIRVGIMGTGFTVGIAKAHINACEAIEDCTVTAMYDVVPGRAKEFAEKFNLGHIPICNSFEDFFAAVDAVCICTHNSVHIESMEKCLAAGKHVICEKPLATSLEEAKKALAFEEKYPDLVKMVVFNYREKPGIAQIKEYIDQGKLGKIFLFRYILGGNRIGNANIGLEWRMQKNLSGTGALADFGCHMLELVDYLVDMGKINQVACFTETFVKERAHLESGTPTTVSNDDATVIIAKTDNGCLCSLTACRLEVPYECIEICGEGGTLSHVLQNDIITTHFKPFNAAFASPPEKVKVEEKHLAMSGHIGILNEFVNCIKTGEKPQRNIELAYYIQKLLDALEQSAETKQFVEVK